MPTPARTSLGEIVQTGRRILEAEGLDGLTMQRVAAEVGVRAPSLYKHVRDRAHLIHLINSTVAGELADMLEASLGHASPAEDLAAMADAYRGFAHAQPEAYRLMFARAPESWRVEPELGERAAAPVLRLAASLAGPEHALDGARLIAAWANGFVSMELADTFRLGGDLDAAFRFGVERLSTALVAGHGIATPGDGAAH
jgi:AcrR family transcriptional regulator